jgi:hypothetical protein
MHSGIAAHDAMRSNVFVNVVLLISEFTQSNAGHNCVIIFSLGNSCFWNGAIPLQVTNICQKQRRLLLGEPNTPLEARHIPIREKVVSQLLHDKALV